MHRLAALLLTLAAPAALAGKLDDSTTIRIEVVDTDGEPILGARIYSLVEEEWNRVNDVTGAHEMRMLNRPDGYEVHLEPGLEVPVRVFAIGYAPAEVVAPVRSKRSKKNRTIVTLSPRPVTDPPGAPTPSAQPSEPEALAVEAWRLLAAGDNAEAQRISKLAAARSAEILSSEALTNRIGALHRVAMVAAWRDWAAAHRATFEALDGVEAPDDATLIRLRQSAFEASLAVIDFTRHVGSIDPLAQELCAETAVLIRACGD